MGSESDFKTNLLKYSGINYDTQIMNFPGAIVAQNIDANVIYGNVTAILPPQANVDIRGNVTGTNVVTNVFTASGNAYSTYFIGNGALLSGVTSSLPPTGSVDIVGNVSAPGNITVAGQITVTGNAYASYLIGNGALLSGLLTSLPARANIDIVGNVTAPGNIYVAGQVNVVGNVSANYLLGNGSLLQGILTSVPSQANIDIVGNVAAPGNLVVAGQVTSVGNVSASYFIGNGALLQGVLKSLPARANMNIVGNVYAPGNISVAGQVLVAGNAAASYFLGNGALLQGVLTSFPSSANIDVIGNVSSPGNITVAGQVTVAGNVTANYFLGNGSLLQGVLTSFPSSANIDIVGNVTSPGNVNVLGQVKVTGNVVATNFTGNGALLTGMLEFFPNVGRLDIVGNVTAPGNIIVQGQVRVIGNTTANYFIGNGAFLQGVLTSLPPRANINIIGNVTAPGNIDVTGQVTVAGNISANYFIGNGSLMQGVLSSLPSRGNIDIVGNLTSSGNLDVLGQVTIVGNLTGNYLIGSGAGISGLYIPVPATSAMDIQGNVVAPGNIEVTGLLQVLGNMSAPYFIGDGAFITGVYAPVPPTMNVDVIGNVTSFGNLVSTGNITSSGNISAPYFIGNGYYLNGVIPNIPTQSNTDIVGNVVAPGNVDVQGQVTVIGNVTANYFVGNGSLLSNTADVLANVIYTDIIGNVTAPGNVFSQSQVTIGGNAIGLYFIGNGILLSNVLTSIPTSIAMDVYGNVIGNLLSVDTITSSFGNIANIRFVGGNVFAPQFVGNGIFLSNVLTSIPGVLSTDIFGDTNVFDVVAQEINVTGDANISGSLVVSGTMAADVLRGNGAFLSLPGYLIVPYGSVANQGARLALTVPIGTIVLQTNNSITYLLNALPASNPSNWSVFDASSVITSAFGRTGVVVAQVGDYIDSQILLSQTIGPFTSGVANVYSILLDIVSNKANITNGNITASQFVGNVTSFGNVDSVVTTARRLQVNGSATITGQADVTGNTSALYILGDGSQLSSLQSQFPFVGAVDIVGNSVSPGNIYVTGQITSLGNVIAQNFYGNIIANTINAFATRVTSSTNAFRMTGSGIFSARNFIGNLVATGNVAASNFIGNMFITGNVTASNLISNIIRVYGNANVANVIAGDMTLGGNLFVVGNTGSVTLNLPTSTFNGNTVILDGVQNTVAGNLLQYNQVVLRNTSSLVLQQQNGNVNNGTFTNGFPTFGDAEFTCSRATMLTYNNQLMGFGQGWTNAQCVAGYPPITPYPTVIPLFTVPTYQIAVSKVKYSLFDALILTQDGRVLTFGQTFAAWQPQVISLPAAARDIFLPPLRNNGTGVSSISPMGATLGNGQLYMWGLNTSGQLGRSSFTTSLIPQVPNGLLNANVIKLTMSTTGRTSTCAVLANGRIATWGYNSAGQLGLSNTDIVVVPSYIPTFTGLAASSNVADAQFVGGFDGFGATADNTSLRILLRDGSSYATGSNRNGELGINNITNSTTFQRESTNRSNIVAIGGMQMVNTCHYIIQNDGQLLFCGNKRSFGVTVGATTQNVFYLGDGVGSYGFQRAMLSTGTTITTPFVRFHASASESQLIAGSTLYWAMIKDNQGNLWMMGNNTTGQLGIGNTDNYMNGFIKVNQFMSPANIPVVDCAATGFLSAVSGGTTVVTTADGRMLSAGVNIQGSAGTEVVPSGTINPYWTPVIGFSSPQNT